MKTTQLLSLVKSYIKNTSTVIDDLSYGHPKNVEILTMSQKIKLALGASSRKNLTTGAPLNGL